MAPVTRRSTSGGISKAPLRKSKTRDDSFSSSGVGLATSALRADADAALQSRPEPNLEHFPVKAPAFPTTLTNGVNGTSGTSAANGINGTNGTNGVHHALQPLSAMAERVGREVEDFAEKVDRWRTKLAKAGEDGSQKYRATMTLVDQLEGIAKDRLHRYQKSSRHGRSSSRSSLRSSSLGGSRTDEAEARVKDAQVEVDTWKLFRIMLEVEYSDPGFDPSASVMEYNEKRGDLTSDTSGGEVWERFLMNNHLAREQNAVLHWLEETARIHGKSMDNILAQLEDRCGNGTSSYDRNWLHTQTALKVEKRTRLANGDMDVDALGAHDVSGTVSQLDPDAPTRQLRPLDPKDAEQEDAVSSACFDMLRSGQEWSEIAEWLAERGEGWRAVSLGIACEEQSARTNVEGSDYGALWREVCYALARNKDTSSNEKALYGLRAGDLPTSLGKCDSWDDHIYVHFNALILGHFRTFLREKVPDSLKDIDSQTFPSPTALEAVGEGYVGADIVNSLKASEQTRTEALSPMKQIQGALISRQFIALAMAVGLAASNNLYTRRLESSHMMPPAPVEVEPSFSAVFEDETALRLCVHFSMIMEALKPGGDSASRWRPLDRVIICYLDALRRAGKFETLPTYAVYMEAGLADKVLGMMLADIANPDEQRTLINLIDQSGMKAVEALFEQVHFALDAADLSWRSSQPILEYQLVEKTSAQQWPGFRIRAAHASVEPTIEEEKIIRAAEWYTLVDGQLYGVLNLLAVIYRSFLVHGRWSAALALTERISYKALLALKTPYYYGKIVDFMDDNPPVPDAQPEEHFRRTTRATSRQPDTAADHGWGGESRGDPERVTLFHKLFKRQGRCYYELMQLTLALKALSDWRAAEARALNDVRYGSRPRSDARKDLQNALDVVSAAVEPLLHGFLTNPRDAEEDGDLELIRRVYLPEVVLAYVSVHHFAATFLSREYFTRALDVASLIADEENRELRDAFVGLGKMEDLVRALTGVSRQLLRKNEEKKLKEGKSTDGASRRRGWDGRTVDIWDVGRLA